MWAVQETEEKGGGRRPLPGSFPARAEGEGRMGPAPTDLRTSCLRGPLTTRSASRAGPFPPHSGPQGPRVPPVLPRALCPVRPRISAREPRLRVPSPHSPRHRDPRPSARRPRSSPAPLRAGAVLPSGAAPAPARVLPISASRAAASAPPAPSDPAGPPPSPVRAGPVKLH